MPTNKHAYRRYQVIDDCLCNGMRRYPSMKDLQQACEDRLDMRFSVSQIQKDIQAMKYDDVLQFYAPIKFSKSNNGYYYSDAGFTIRKVKLSNEEIKALHEVAAMLKIFSGSRVSDYFNQAVQKIDASLKAEFAKDEMLPVIDIERPSAHRGIEYFDLFLSAAQSRMPVCFIHYSYSKKRFNSIVLHTYMLKEFHNRWYVIGYSEQHKAIRTFGLDRINDPLLLNSKFREPKGFNAEYYSRDLYGVFPVNNRKKEQMVFHTDAFLSNYLKSNPIHHSQQIVQDHEDGSAVLKIHVVPTVELLKEFAYNPNLKVLEPEWVIAEIRNMRKGEWRMEN